LFSVNKTGADKKEGKRSGLDPVPLPGVCPRSDL
jgi:hypothetical protein